MHVGGAVMRPPCILEGRAMPIRGPPCVQEHGDCDVVQWHTHILQYVERRGALVEPVNHVDGTLILWQNDVVATRPELLYQTD